MTWPTLVLLAWAPRLVAGAADPAVSQETIATTICIPGWATTHRPPEAWTEPLKRRLFFGQRAPGRLRDYQLDHLIPLSLGGCGQCLDNLWLEPIPDARTKDRVEGVLHRAVCGGQMPLESAQQEMRRWKPLR